MLTGPTGDYRLKDHRLRDVKHEAFRRLGKDRGVDRYFVSLLSLYRKRLSGSRDTKWTGVT